MVSQHSEEPLSLSTEHIDAVPGPAGGDLEAIWDAERERHLFKATADKVKQQVNPEHYQLFDLYVIQKWPVKKNTRRRWA